MLQYFCWRNTFPQQLWTVNYSINLLIWTVFPPIPLCNGQNLQYLYQNVSVTYFLVRLHCMYNLYLFTVKLYHIYYLYYLVLRISTYLCAAIVKLYPTYYLYYLVLRVSFDLCAAYLYYFDALTQILRALAELTKFLLATSYHCPPPLKFQWWRSHSSRTPPTVDPPAMPYLRQVHPTN